MVGPGRGDWMDGGVNGCPGFECAIFGRGDGVSWGWEGWEGLSWAGGGGN